MGNLFSSAQSSADALDPLDAATACSEALAASGEVSGSAHESAEYNDLNHPRTPTETDSPQPMDIECERHGDKISDDLGESLAAQADSFIIAGQSIRRETMVPLRTLGKGETSVVVEVACPQTGRIFALKSMSKGRTLDRDGNVEMTGVSSSEVNAEVLALQLLADCPFATNLVGHTEDAENVHLLMDCSQCDLFCVMHEAEAKNAALSPGQIQFIMAQVVEVLDELHQNQFIYRDLKPENILVDTDGYIKLCDFGASFKLVSPNEKTKTVTGTPDYMAPEMIRNQGHNRAVDYWAMGCLLYDMICQEPFADTGSTDDDEILAAILEYTRTRKLKWKNGSKKVRVSRSTKSLVEDLLHPDPTKRLGMVNGADDIRNHAYFDKFDWSSLRSKTLSIPVDWRPSPKLCGKDLTTEHQDEAPEAALQRMKNEYFVLRQQYIRMLTLNSDATSLGSDQIISRKRVGGSQPSFDLRDQTTSQRQKLADHLADPGGLAVTESNIPHLISNAED